MSLRLSLFNLSRKMQGREHDVVLAKGATSSFAVKVLGAAVAFCTQILLARILGVTQYGIYIYALTWISVLALICQLGMNTSILRFVSSYKAKSEWGLLRGIFIRSVQYVLFASVAVGVTAAFVVWFLYDRIGREQSITFWIAFLLLPLLSLTGLRSAGLRAFKHVVKAALPDSLFRPMLIAGLASISYVYFQQNLQATQVMVFNLIGTLAAFYIGGLWLIKAMPKQIRHITPVYAEQEWLKVSLPLFFISGMQLILHQIDILMIGAILDSEQVGIYSVASRITGLVVFGLSAVNSIAAPMISELYSTGRHQELQRTVTLAARGIFVFTLIASMSLAIMGEYVLGFFGDEFVIGYIPLIILLGGQAINAMSGSVGFLMIMTGHHNQAAMIIGGSAILNILMNAIFIPLYGIVGAAISTAATTALWNLMMLAYVWRRMDINPTVLSNIQ